MKHVSNRYRLRNAYFNILNLMYHSRSTQSHDISVTLSLLQLPYSNPNQDYQQLCTRANFQVILDCSNHAGILLRGCSNDLQASYFWERISHRWLKFLWIIFKLISKIWIKLKLKHTGIFFINILVNFLIPLAPNITLSMTGKLHFYCTSHLLALIEA